MHLPNQQRIQTYFYTISLITSMVVFGLSIFHGYSFIMIVLRTILSFVVVFYLGKGLMGLWVTLTPPPPKTKPQSYGSTIDVLLGNDDDDEIQESMNGIEQERLIPGQINSDLKNSLQDPENKADISKRMGFNENVT